MSQIEEGLAGYQTQSYEIEEPKASEGYNLNPNQSFHSTTSTMYKRSEDPNRYRLYVGSSLVFLGIASGLLLLVFILFLADCYFNSLQEARFCDQETMWAFVVSIFLELFAIGLFVGMVIRFRKDLLTWAKEKTAKVWQVQKVQP